MLFEYTHRCFFINRKYRRRAPGAFADIPSRRRFPIFKNLLQGNESEALRLALNIPRRHWRKFHEADRSALLQKCKWADLEPGTAPHFDTIRHQGLTLHAPAADFRNGTCLEFPLADEYLRSYLDGGDPESLLLLFATLWREPGPDGTLALQRDDRRVPLHSRAEVRARAEMLNGLALEYQIAALLYFTGVKEMVSRLFGQWLFEGSGVRGQGSEDQEAELRPEAAEKKEGDPLGWWGLYMDRAAGDPTRLKAILQSNFLEFCLMEVRQRKQLREAEMRHRMAAPDWGRE